MARARSKAGRATPGFGFDVPDDVPETPEPETERLGLLRGSIGAEIAKLFASEGSKVIFAARTMREGDHPLEGSLEGTIPEIREAGGIGHLWSEHGGMATAAHLRSVEMREVDYERIPAKLSHGVLEVELPRAAQAEPRRIQVNAD